MEDAHSVITTLPHHENSAFFGVFDGHSGYKASEYCAAHFHDFLDKYDTIDAKAITEATMAVDKSFMEEFSTADDGCTATYCVVHSNDSTHHYPIYNERISILISCRFHRWSWIWYTCWQRWWLANVLAKEGRHVQRHKRSQAQRRRGKGTHCEGEGKRVDEQS